LYTKQYWAELFNDVYEKTKLDKLYYLRHPKYLILTKLRRMLTNYKYEAMELNYLGWKYWHHPRF
jgi:hypothetical protein